MQVLKILFVLIASATWVAPQALRPLVIGPAPANSLELFVDKTGLMSGKRHRFVFQDYELKADYNPAAPSSPAVRLRIAAKSIRCTDTWVSPADLKKVEKTALDDMLAAERYPDIRFASTNVRQSGPDTYEVTGELTIRDRAKPVKVSVTELRGATTAFRGTAIVRLSDFGLKPPSAALGLVGTKDEMTLMFSLAAARAPE